MLNQDRSIYIFNLKQKDQIERKSSIDELFSDIINQVHELDSEAKLRFIESYFYVNQTDIRQTMIDFDALHDADRLVASYIIKKLAQGSRRQEFSKDGQFFEPS